MANGRTAYSGLSPAWPPIAAGGGGNIVEWSLDAAAAAGWSGAAAGAARVFREGGVRRRWRQWRGLRVEAAQGERKKGRKRAGSALRRRRDGRAPHLSAAAGVRGGGAAPCPRSLQRNRSPTRWHRAAAEATGAGAVGRAEATAMAFLKLRDQVGEGRQGGIAPLGEEGKEAGQRCGPPGRPLGSVAAREAGSWAGEGREAAG